MGKGLIIKGADFYDNAVDISPGTPVYYNDYTSEVLEGNTTFSTTNKFYMLPESVTALGLKGKTIQVVKFKAAAAGTVTIGLYVYGSGSTILDEYSYSVPAGENIIRLRKALVTSETLVLMVGGRYILPMWNDADDAKGWKITRPGQSASNYASYRVPISLGYFSE